MDGELKRTLSEAVDAGQKPPKVCCKDCAYSWPGINADWLRCTYDHYRLLVSPTSACGCGKPKEVSDGTNNSGRATGDMR